MPEQALDDILVKALSTNAAQLEVYDSGFSVGGSFGVRLSKTGRKAFFVVYPLHGKRKRLTLGNFPLFSVAEARQKALEVVHKATRGEDAAAEWRVYRRSGTFSEVGQLFVSEYLVKKSPSTAQEYRRIVHKELGPIWGDRKIQDIRQEDVTRLLEHIANVRGTPVLAARVRAVASSLFSFAKQRGFRPDNPVRETDSPAAREPRRRILTTKELHQLLEALVDEQPLTQALFKVLILTGQRIKHVLRMRWSEIRVDCWCIPNSTAPDSVPQIYLVPPLLQALAKMKGGDAAQPLIFPSVHGGARRTLARAVQRLNKRMRASPAWNALDLYRTFQFGLARLGIRPDIIDVIQQRRSGSFRIRISDSAYDYSDEIRDALLLWAKTVIPPPAPGGERSRVLRLT